VAAPSFRRYDVQAKYSVIASTIAIGPLLLAVFGTWRQFEPKLVAIKYNESGMYPFLFLACVAVAMLLSAIGLSLGFNSAGQRRNNEQRKSWTGFFLGTGVLCLSVIIFAAFAMLRLPIKIS
jgi:hypothetical protein